MADVNIRNLEFDSTQASNQPFPVKVKINNLETVGPVGFGPVACSGGGLVTNQGHMTDVTLKIRNQFGTTVWEETKGECVPVNRPSELMGANAVVEFTPTLEAGEYSVQASLQVRGDNGSDTSDPRSLTVESDVSSLPTGDDSGNPWWNPEGADDDDPEEQNDGSNGDGSGLPNPFGGQVVDDKIIIVVALLALAWMFSSASEVAS